jgi:hypothetical protein
VLRSVHPPDVIAAGVDQLELEIIIGRFATQAKIEAIILGIIQFHIALQADITGDAVEVVVETERRAVRIRNRTNLAADLGRCDDAPNRWILEFVERPGRFFGMRYGCDQQQAHHCAFLQRNDRHRF